MLTPLLLDAISKKIEIASKKDANNGYFSVVLYSLSIFKVILLTKKLWPSKAANLMKIPFLFNNFKTYFSHNTTDNYAK